MTLTTDVFMATDGTGKPEKLLYAVSVPPVPGQIEPINYPGCPIPCTASQMDWPRGFAVCVTVAKGPVRRQSGERVPFLHSSMFSTTTPHVFHDFSESKRLHFFFSESSPNKGSE